MATKQERIRQLRDRAAKYRQSADAKECEARKLEIEDRKVQADRNRKDENRAKVLLGVVLLAVENRFRAPVIRAIPSVLEPRDAEFLSRWRDVKEGDSDQSTFSARLAAAFSAAKLAQDSDESMQKNLASNKLLGASSSTDNKFVPAVIDPVGAALKSILGSLAEGEFGLIAPDILSRASEDQRVVLDSWIAARTMIDAEMTDSSIEVQQVPTVNSPSADETGSPSGNGLSDDESE